MFDANASAAEPGRVDGSCFLRPCSMAQCRAQDALRARLRNVRTERSSPSCSAIAPRSGRQCRFGNKAVAGCLLRSQGPRIQPTSFKNQCLSRNWRSLGDSRTPVFAVMGDVSWPLDEGSLRSENSPERAAAQAIPLAQIPLQLPTSPGRRPQPQSRVLQHPYKFRCSARSGRRSTCGVVLRLTTHPLPTSPIFENFWNSFPEPSSNRNDGRLPHRQVFVTISCEYGLIGKRYATNHFSSARSGIGHH